MWWYTESVALSCPQLKAKQAGDMGSNPGAKLKEESSSSCGFIAINNSSKLSQKIQKENRKTVSGNSRSNINSLRGLSKWRNYRSLQNHGDIYL
ncbi:hypothetical protein WA026_007185 [Henosepilachna vigintioctopunctata]|uniref:Uncharacterized protein n=1 Tax=Henosepilachna vigintioctopunctata TaxID=420089 RepID=A0AAW1VD08_9CUCU